jgi:hypothetical protein
MNQEKKSFFSLLSDWRKRYKMHFQGFALVLAMVVPFALYLSLESGRSLLTTALLALLALGMAITAWVG